MTEQCYHTTTVEVRELGYTRRDLVHDCDLPGTEYRDDDPHTPYCVYHVYRHDGPLCGCCGQATIPPRPGTDEEYDYCEGCGTAWTDPTAVSAGSCYIHRNPAT